MSIRHTVALKLEHVQWEGRRHFQFLSITSAGNKLRSNRAPPKLSFLERFCEGHKLASELPEADGLSASFSTPTKVAKELVGIYSKLVYVFIFSQEVHPVQSKVNEYEKSQQIK